ncbi:MAG: TldD/PmbA family protein [Anaerolineales bacterium]|nr:TldD/PmbA family protein [Anaerolineales bacterium]
MIPHELVQKVLHTALRNGGDLAEVYLENQEILTLNLDDGKLEKSTQGNDTGGGVRVFYGNMAAYAYTDDLGETALLEAASAAAAASHGASKSRTTIDLTRRQHPVDLSIQKDYDLMPLAEKAALLRQMDAAARGYHSAIRQVRATYNQVRRKVWIYNSDGVWAEDDRNFIEFTAEVVAERDGLLQSIRKGMGGQIGLELMDGRSPIDLAVQAAESAVIMLESRPAPAGETTVVITNGWGGVLFHEACGHALEADFITNGSSAYSGLVGQQVASPLITAIDDGTIPARRGSLRFDDEGTPTQRTVLIENGILKEYMWDLAEARKVGRQSTGNGRRQSYQFMPMPRMTNTFIDRGRHNPQEIISSVKKGIFVKNLGGGQADHASGDFVFSVTEGYMIEDGHITTPVRGATLVGNGPKVLKEIDMVGDDLALDGGYGTCGKLQSAKVSVGQPTVRIPKLTVGGTE